MPKAATKPAKRQQVEEDVEEEKDYTTYLEKDPTPTQERFGQWVLDKTGYEANDEDDFLSGVQLATALRMEFQRSPENQEFLAERRAAAAQQKAEREAARANGEKRGRGRPKKAVAPVGDVEDDEDEEATSEAEAPRPKRRGRPPKSAAAKSVKSAPPAKKPARRRTKPVAVEEDDEDTAPF